MTSQLPAVPPGPADTAHPRRALARLALSSAYREAADFAAGGVPTVSDEYGDAYDTSTTPPAWSTWPRTCWSGLWSTPASGAAGGMTSPRP